jgi:NAD(P)-dependent dehydrogenase (short-subunit alcohol dehydrogenase family)
MPEEFNNKVVLVTGASSGIGRATALTFARKGAKIIAADVVVKGGEETVRAIHGVGGEAIFVKTDVSKAAEVEALVTKAVNTYGRLDCAYNNAGVLGSIVVPTHEYTEEAWDRVININLKGVWLCMKYEIPQMLIQGGGAIVNTSSAWGLVGAGGFSAYVASKHGVAGLTKTAALEYAKSGIRINAVNPGVINTPMVESAMAHDAALGEQIIALEPVGRMGTPEEIAEAVLWLCSEAASFVTGHMMIVDGGYVAQ